MSKTFTWCWTTTAAAVAGALCLPGWAPAEEHGHREIEHRGSIRYAVPEPHREIHVEHGVGSIRYEHHELERRGPLLIAPHYSHDYFAHFRPGFRSVLIGPSSYYYYPALPPGCQTVVVNGQSYYLCGGIYYMPYLYEGNTIFVVVPPPIP